MFVICVDYNALNWIRRAALHHNIMSCQRGTLMSGKFYT